MHEDRKQQLAEFVAWVAQHIKGDEKGEAQIFLDRLFAAFGRKGVKEAGATLEQRIKKADNRGTAFADLVWKPIVLIEMKRRGEDLMRHYRQAFDYWTRLVPGRPRYVVLCNFDEFWIYDFETQMDTPVDRLALAELPDRWGPLAFLFPTDEKPIFGNDHEAVTRKAADQLAVCFNKLIARKVDRGAAQRFILQMLVALFAEDIGLLDQYTVTRLLEECQKPGDAYDLLGGLFVAMNTPGVTAGGRFKGVQYFNGGLFARPAHIELWPDEVAQLRQAARADWSQVRPEIFGVLFEHSMEKGERHAFGAHFTSPVDIMKIVGPTIVEPWREQIENATTMARLKTLLSRMHEFTVLDPASGSGNFLYIAYRELKRLEARILERLGEMSRKFAAEQRAIGFVTAANFYGMDVNPFAIELAKVTMMIARKLAIDELHVSEHALPLDNLDANFSACDALIDQQGNPTPWPKVDAIIGNPPFLGAKRLKPERGADYVNAIRKAYPEVPGMADYCVYWFRRAHDLLKPCTLDDPLTGRAGLVGTQNIRNNQSRVGGLDRIVRDGTIVEAVDNQPWSGEANVHVAIANWVKSHDKPVLPERRRLWQTVAPSLLLHEGQSKAPGRKAKEIPGKKRGPRKNKVYELSFHECEHISSSLSCTTDVSTACALESNRHPQSVFQGVTPGYAGFVLNAATRNMLVRGKSGENSIVRPYLIGRELVSGDGRPRRFIIDADRLDLLSLMQYESVFEHLKKHVLTAVQQKLEEVKSADSDMVHAREEHLNRWWTFWAQRIDLRGWMRKHARVVAASRTQSRPFLFEFVSTAILPGDKLQLFAFDDDFSFGILQARPHCEWYRAKGARLKNEVDFNYSSASVFDTFPWPQSPSKPQIDAVAAAGREVRRIRAEALAKVRGGLRAVYRTLELPGKNPLKDAHAALDAAVLAAYSFSDKKDLLSQLLDLNREVASRIENGQPVVAPGIPPSYPDSARLISDDCIRTD